MSLFKQSNENSYQFLKLMVIGIAYYTRELVRHIETTIVAKEKNKRK